MDLTHPKGEIVYRKEGHMDLVPPKRLEGGGRRPSIIDNGQSAEGKFTNLPSYYHACHNIYMIISVGQELRVIHFPFVCDLIPPPPCLALKTIFLPLA